MTVNCSCIYESKYLRNEKLNVIREAKLERQIAARIVKSDAIWEASTTLASFRHDSMKVTTTDRYRAPELADKRYGGRTPFIASHLPFDVSLDTKSNIVLLLALQYRSYCLFCKSPCQSFRLASLFIPANRRRLYSRTPLTINSFS